METFVLLFSVGYFNGSSIWNVIITVSLERLGNPDVIPCLRDSDVGLVLPSGQIYAASFLCFGPPPQTPGSYKEHRLDVNNLPEDSSVCQELFQA